MNEAIDGVVNPVVKLIDHLELLLSLEKVSTTYDSELFP